MLLVQRWKVVLAALEHQVPRDLKRSRLTPMSSSSSGAPLASRLALRKDLRPAMTRDYRG
jgi:hypothetical protein